MPCNEDCNCSICDLSLQIPWRWPNHIIRFNNAADCFEAVPLNSLLSWTDIRVSVDAEDATCPWFLFDKLVSSDDTISIAKQTIWDCKKVNLRINKNNLNFSFLDLTDTPSAYIDCTTQCWYPANAYVKINSAWNWLIFDCECCDKAYASYTLTDNIIINQQTLQEKFYILCWTAWSVAIPWLTEPTVPNNRNVHVQVNLQVESWCIEFDQCTAWDYRVSFDWHREVNKWIHWARIWLLFLRWWQAYYFTETRRSWLSDLHYVDTTAANHSTIFWPFWNNELTTAWWWNWPQFSLWRHEERRPVGKSRIISIMSWDRITPYAKLSTYMTWDNDAAITWQFAVLGWSPWTSVTWDSWFNISLNKL